MTKTIAVIMNEEMSGMLNQLKDILGVHNTTEIIRFCIKYTRSNIS